MLYAAYAMHDLVHHAHVGLVTPLLQGLEPQLLQPLLLDVAGQAGHHAHSLLLNFLQHIFVSFRPRGPGWCAKLEVGPHILYIQPYKNVPIPTRCVLSVSQAEIQSQTLPLMPWAMGIGHAPSSAASLWVLYQMLWQNPKISGPSAALVAFSRNSNRFVAQDFPCLNPRWLALINLFRSRCAVMESHITDSIALQGTEIIRWIACAL